MTRKYQVRYVPTAEDIRRGCEKVQSRWSPEEKRKRAGASRRLPWLPPILPMPDLKQMNEGRTVKKLGRASSVEFDCG